MKGLIESFTDENTDKAVKFTLVFPSNKLSKLVKADTLEKKLKLTKKINITNMHLFNTEGTIKKFANAREIINEFYNERLQIYDLRKAYQLRLLNNEMLHLKYKVMFIEYVLDGKIVINNKTKQSIIDKLVEYKFPELSKDINSSNDSKSYNYLTTMALFSLTKEKIEELNREYKEKKEELESLENMETKNIWKNELKEFVTCYKRWSKASNDEFMQEIESIKKAEKKTKKKGSKVKGSKKKDSKGIKKKIVKQS